MPGKWWYGSVLLLAMSSATAQSGEELPDMAMLEFLGSFEQQDQDWLDNELDESTQTSDTSDEGQQHD